MIVAPNPALDQAEDSWRVRALCRESDPELVFPMGTRGHEVGTIEQAKSICSLDLDGAAVALDRVPDDGQSEACAAGLTRACGVDARVTV